MTAPQLTVYADGGPPLTGDGLNTFEQTCDTVADLRALVGVPGVQVYCRGTAVVGDGGQGIFYWNTNSTAADDNGATTVVPYGSGSGAWTRLAEIANTAFGQCRLVYSSPTQIQLAPFQGNRVSFPNGPPAVLESSVSANPTAASINGAIGALAASTLYYVYLFLNGGVPTLDFSVTGHTIDLVSGIECKSGDTSRVLVGMVRTNGSAQFQSDGANSLVLSWFNRFWHAINGATGGAPTVPAGSEQVIAAGMRVSFLAWNTGDGFELLIAGYASNTNSGASTDARILLDGGSGASGYAVGTHCATGAALGLPAALASSVAEGYHYADISGFCSAGSTTWNTYLVGGAAS